ncbi:MAG: hypothetical protein JST42_04125, partial [Bacteroidetes bacterium]|nr:hypothetical protein [Bacteroidota bacterium]
RDGTVRYLPAVPDEEWIGGVVEALRGGRAFIAGRKEELAEAVEMILSRVTVGELVIEGGATAYAILERLGIERLVPERELAPGVVRMRAAGGAGARGSGYCVTVKPGSYPWPDGLTY